MVAALVEDDEHERSGDALVDDETPSSEEDGTNRRNLVLPNVARISSELRELCGEDADDERTEEFLKNNGMSVDGFLSDEAMTRIEIEILEPLRNLRIALIVVDFQNDFVAGSLSIKKGRAAQDPKEALEPLNKLLEQCNFAKVVYTMDWHPFNHISFYEHCRNADRKLCQEDKARKLRPFSVVRFETPDTIQVIYPAHCVQGTWGSDLDPELRIVPDAHFIRKGSDVFVETYSGFGTPSKHHSKYRSELESLLRADNVDAVLVCGLALDVCVHATLRDAAQLHFLAALINDCSAGLNHDQIASCKRELAARQVAFICSHRVADILQHRRLPWEWVLVQSAKAAKKGLGQNTPKRRESSAVTQRNGKPQEPPKPVWGLPETKTEIIENEDWSEIESVEEPVDEEVESPQTVEDEIDPELA